MRSSLNTELNLVESYKKFEESSKVMWVFPEKVYPKNEISKNKDIQIPELIATSPKKKFNLQIIPMRYEESQVVGFVFKFMEINKKSKKGISSNDLVPSNKNEIIFDLLSLKYIRTVLVEKKSGFRNLREKEEYIINDNVYKSSVKKRKKGRNKMQVESSDDDDEKIEVVLNKEKILELESMDSNEIKNFINLLPFYGNEVSLIKHRPNKERYPSGKAQEPLIRIDVSNLLRKIESKLRDS